MNETLVHKLNAVPVGYIVVLKVQGVAKERFLRRNWTRVCGDYFSRYIGDAQVWKTATAALANCSRFSNDPSVRLSYTVRPVYSDPRATGMQALVA